MLILAERHYDMETAKMGDESPFAPDSYYAERAMSDIEYSEQWRNFERSLKSEARFFSRVAEDMLKAIFADFTKHRTKKGSPIIVEVGPGCSITTLFRARVFQSDEKLTAALKRPDQEIGPPPSLQAPAGRMNARGISVFYGATNPQISVAEVRPPVGSRVVVGRFDVIRVLKLLDLRALSSVKVEGSIFDPAFAPTLKRAKFLEGLSHRLTMPVMPDDEPFDYLVTQAVSDYLATVAEPPLDGIIFPSVQVASKRSNVVLFHKASKVEPLNISSSTEIDAHLSTWTDEGPEVDYFVYEKCQPAEPEKKSRSFDPIAFFQGGFSSQNADDRPITLRLDITSIEVQHVESVKFRTTSYPVRRNRFAAKPPKY